MKIKRTTCKTEYKSTRIVVVDLFQHFFPHQFGDRLRFLTSLRWK